MSTEDDLPCPACGFLSFQGGYGSYDICSICDWEDDGVQLANPCSGGGANHKSLAQVQADALRQYPPEVQEARDTKRSPRWRPLTPQELDRFEKERATSHWTHMAVVDEREAYWLGQAAP